jgi:hypothetical protein
MNGFLTLETFNNNTFSSAELVTFPFSYTVEQRNPPILSVGTGGSPGDASRLSRRAADLVH